MLRELINHKMLLGPTFDISGGGVRGRITGSGASQAGST
jgi:hypothetical protein